MEFSNNVSTQHLGLIHDDETDDSDSVVPDPSIMGSSVNTDINSVSDVATRFENMDISLSSNSRDISGVDTIAVCVLTSSDAAETVPDINDIKKVTKDSNDISNTDALTTIDIDESTDDDKNADDASETNNNNEVTRTNDILNVTEDNNDISYTVLTTVDIDGSADDAKSIVDDVANTNNNEVTLINAPIPNDQSTIDSVKMNAPLSIVPTSNCNESPDMANIIRIVTRSRTNNTNKPFSQAVESPLPSEQDSKSDLHTKEVSSPSLPNKKPSRLPVPVPKKQGSTPPPAPNKQSSTPALSNNQGSIPYLHDEQGFRPPMQMHGSTLFLPDHRTLHSSMVIPPIAVHTQSCCECPSQLIIQPQISINMETCCNYCCPQEPFSVPPNIPRPNTQFPPPQYPQFNRAPFPHPQLNRARFPYPQFNRAPLPHRQYSRAPLLSYSQFVRALLHRKQQDEQTMFVPRRNGQSEPRVGSSPHFYRTRMPYMEHWQRNSPRPKNMQPMQGNFPAPQGFFPHSYNNRLPNIGFSRGPTPFPSVGPYFQPQNPNEMVNPYWQNNIPDAPINLPSFHGAPVYPMPPPSFYPGQWFPGDFNEFRESINPPSRFEGRPPPGFGNVELEPIPETPELESIQEPHEVNDKREQITRKKGQLPLYLRKT